MPRASSSRPARAATRAATPPVSAPVTSATVDGATRVRKAPAKRTVTRAPAAAEPSTQSRNGGSSRRSPAPRRRGVRRVGIMGGTFDPIHHGHLVAASEVASRFLLDEVIFVPTGQPWQKPPYDVSAAEDRYLMTVIATASNPRFSVSRVDIDRDGPTYTVDTLRDMKSFFGSKADLFFITGADALDKILSWKDANQVFELAHFVGVTRPGFVLSDDHLPEATVSLVQVPAMAISSTDCRARVGAGLPVWYLVPDGVVQYINKRQLYR